MVNNFQFDPEWGAVVWCEGESVPIVQRNNTTRRELPS